MPHAVKNTLAAREFMCFRSIYYEVDLESISVDFPEERIGTCESVCRDCSQVELDGRAANPCFTCVHSIVKASGEEWTERYKRRCYFCMKPMYEARSIKNCSACQKEEANLRRRYLACI